MKELLTKIRIRTLRTVVVGVTILSLLAAPVAPGASAQVPDPAEDHLTHLRFDGASSPCGGSVSASPLLVLWDRAADKSGYEYRDKRPGDTDWSDVKEMDISVTRHELWPVDQGIYRVALRADSVPDAGWVECSVTYDTDAPGITELVAPDMDTAINHSAPVTLVWRTNDMNPVGYTYEIRVTQDQPGPDGNLPDSPAGNKITDSTSYELRDIGAGRWFWQVRAIDDAANRGAWSSYRQFVIEGVPEPPVPVDEPGETPLIIVPNEPTPLQPVVSVPELAVAQPVAASSASDEIGNVFGRVDGDASIETILPATSEVLGLTSGTGNEEAGVTLQATPSGWKVLGILWYWWLAGLAAALFIGWLLKGLLTSLSLPTPADT